MNEINFFEQSKHSKLSGNNPAYLKYIPILVGCILLLLLIGLNVYYNTTIAKLESEVNNLNVENKLEQKNSEGSTDDQSSDNVMVDIKTQSITEIENFDTIKNIDSEVIEQIQASVPAGLFLNTFNVVDDDLEITGFSKDSDAIAQFQYNLNKSDRLYEAFVPVIDNELGSFSFTVTAKIRS